MLAMGASLVQNVKNLRPPQENIIFIWNVIFGTQKVKYLFRTLYFPKMKHISTKESVETTKECNNMSEQIFLFLF